jgi:DNA polymerase III alpha subunit
MATLPIMQPRRFYDIAVQVAIIRPGPIVGDLVHPYLNRRTRREDIEYIHPDFEPILKRTLGVPLFQEQVLRMAMEIADFTGTEADELRRAMACKRADELMVAVTEKLEARMSARGIAKEVQDKIIHSIGSFALYGFPESHAISFALIAYASCWLKVHRAVEFYCGLINNQPMGFYSVNTLMQDAKRHGVHSKPVCVVNSQGQTTVIDDGTLRLGLNRIKGLQQRTIDRLEETRAQRKFDSLPDFLNRVRPNKKERPLNCLVRFLCRRVLHHFPVRAATKPAMSKLLKTPSPFISSTTSGSTSGNIAWYATGLIKAKTNAAMSRLLSTPSPLASPRVARRTPPAQKPPVSSNPPPVMTAPASCCPIVPSSSKVLPVE